MKKLLIAAVITSFAFCIFAGCKPSAKGEMDKWEVNKKDLLESATNWPSFKAILDKKMADAQKLWDEALKLTDEAAKSQKMKEANDFLNDLLNQFTQIKYKVKGIEDSISKFNSKKLTKVEDLTRQKAVSSARNVLVEVQKMLSTAKVKAEDEAKTITQDIISKLISAQGDIDRAIKSLEPQKTTTKKKK
jgi:hypothetical protein